MWSVNLAIIILAGTVQSASREERSAISYVWNGGVIPFQFESNWEQRDKDMFLRATNYIQDRTCVKFRERQDGDDCTLRLVYGGCCGTYGGRQPWCEKGGTQDLTMDKGLILPFYLHELGHTVGFPHEQDRPDRDEYIYWDKNKENCHGDGFAGKVGNLDQAALDIPFDYVSLMADWTECYWPQPQIPVPKDIPLGPGGRDDRTFSVIDIERINAVYDCRGCHGYRFRKVEQLAANMKPMQAGYELNGKPFYVCRGYHEGHLLLGKSMPDDNKCWLTFDGEEKEYHDRFEVLTNPFEENFGWNRRPNDFSIPGNAIKGGRTKDRETVYIARCKIDVNGTPTQIPGFVMESNPKEARIPFGGGTRKCNDFEYLVCNH